MSRALGTVAFTFGAKPHQHVLGYQLYGYDPRNSADAVQVYANVLQATVCTKAAEQRRILNVLLGQAGGDQS